jgi:D-glycero-alpha-D-manno-heptose-7-phosphate kinase
MQKKQHTSVLTVRSRAPIRLDLAGGWTDVAPFSSEVGGAVVNAAINRYSYTTLKLNASDGIRLVSADYGLSLTLPGDEHLPYDGQLDMLKAGVNLLGPHSGIELFVRADAPPGSGTGSSGATGVAILGALNAVRPQPVSLHQLAETAHRLEVEELHVAGGKQDQYAAALGGINYLEFKDPYVSSSPLRLSDAAINEMEKRLILCYTGHTRVSGDIISAVQGAYRAHNNRTLGALHRMVGIADEMRGALLRGEVDAMGPLLLENWACQKDLHPSVTNPDIDHLFDVALANGATGGKALGAGGGGCLLFMAIADREHEVSAALAKEGVEIMHFNLDRQGLQVWQAG